MCGRVKNWGSIEGGHVPHSSSYCEVPEERNKKDILRSPVGVLYWFMWDRYGLPWDYCSARSNAAKAGKLDVFQQALSHGVPWDGMACHSAARRG